MHVNNEKIKVVFMDYDGTLSDGKIYLDQDGKIIKNHNVKDSYIIKNLSDKIDFVIISGSDMNFFKERAQNLGIVKIYDNVQTSKFNIINNFLKTKKLSLENCCFIGDDLIDIDALKNCFSACPSDCTKEVKKYCDYICEKRGGDGCLREFIEYLKIK